MEHCNIQINLKYFSLFLRWEAAQIPKVKVAKFDGSKFNKEQSVYMPQIPDIAQCPEYLLPLKQWEDSFLADFSELRLVVLMASVFFFFLFKLCFCFCLCSLFIYFCVSLQKSVSLHFLKRH